MSEEGNEAPTPISKHKTLRVDLRFSEPFSDRSVVSAATLVLHSGLKNCESVGVTAMGDDCPRNCNDVMWGLSPKVAAERMKGEYIEVDAGDPQAALERIFEALETGKPVVAQVVKEEAEVCSG